jgi:glycolate oxidase iron-sulfur subunit
MNASLLELSKYEKETEQCMKCGFCSYVCPVYQEERIESGVARGKNELVKRLLSGELEMNRELADRFYKCTSCAACTESCPAKAPIPRLLVAAKADIARNKGMRFPYGTIYRHLLSNRPLLGSFLGAASIFQSLFMPKSNGIIRHMPGFLSGIGKGRQIPSISSKFLRQQAPAISKPRQGKSVMRVGYFTGCMNEFVLPHLGLKTIDFLTNHGIEVVMPREQGCCGAAVFLGGGDFETARRIADSNVMAFIGLDYIVADCATCACALREYQRFLPDTPERREAYADFAGRVTHISQFIDDILRLPASAFATPPALKGKKITWHDPCHLNRHLGAKEQPRRILKSLEGTNFIEMPGADKCCGMGGQFSLLNYELSQKIGQKKIESIESTEADIVVTACPGCQFQLLDNIVRLKKPQKVMSLMEIIG